MSPLSELHAGARVAGYRIEGVLGRGGMAVVYRASQPGHEQPVALKLIVPSSSWEEEARERFKQEARLARAVVHPHILPVYEAGEFDGLVFVTMKLEATDLAALLRQEGRLTASRAVSLVSQVASALDAAHAHGLVHRDVKPQNVLLGDEEGEEHAYVSDFGVARAAFSRSLTLSGDMVGTVGYASPEQIRGETVDHRSDVYGLGCLLYECLTGQTPFPRTDSLATAWAHLYDEPPEPSALVPGLPTAFDGVVARALAKSRNARFSSAGGLARAALEAVSGRAEPSPVQPPRRAAAALPSGTVTFLLTDVEGSTKLLHELGTEGYAEALAEHRRIIREAFARNGGVEVDTQGDAFFGAFAAASGAAHAAVEIGEELAPQSIKVRIGLHTGTPHLTSEGYVGIDVHRAARIAAAGHGGQVVVSETTASLLGEWPALTSLGAHRMKDFEEPVSLFQFGDGAFPALKTIANTNLPTPVSSFLGREQELLDASALLEETRLLTVTGPGGQGKTRFALELASRAKDERFSDYPDGVFSCFLAPLRDHSLVLPTLCQTLSMREQPGLTALDALSSHLLGKRMLLLLDNLEHLLPCAGELSELLSRAPGLTLLCTSRELLRLQGELAYELPALADVEAVALYCERARVEPSQPIHELCSRLDGLPLAIELATARMKLLSPEQLLERLSQRLDLLKAGRDADPRQQTLRATIAWSYELLTSEEQALFARLSIFAGGCTLEAAEDVCSADLDALESLIDKSLIRARLDDAGQSRYWMLETIREFAADELDQRSEAEEIADKHVEWLEERVTSLHQPARLRDPQAMSSLHSEWPNARVALARALETEQPASAQRIISGLWFSWLTGGAAGEGDDWASRVIAMPSAVTAEYGRALLFSGQFPRFLGDPQRARDLLQRAVVVFEETGPRTMVAVAHTDLAAELADLGELDEAERHAVTALEMRRELDDQAQIAHSLEAVALIERRRGSSARALELYSEAVELWEAAGFPLEAAQALVEIGDLARLLGYRPRAQQSLCDALRRSREGRDALTEALAVSRLGAAYLDDGDAERGTQLLACAVASSELSGVSLPGVEDDLNRARASLEPESFERLWEVGCHLTAEQVDELACGV